MRTAIFLISIACIIASCKKKDNTLIDPPTEISFSIEKVNSDNNYTSETKQFSLNKKSERWRLNTFEDSSRLSISREVKYNVELENGETIELGFWFGKSGGVNKDDVVLERVNDDEFTFNTSGNKWHYKDFEFELENFYRNNNDFRISINWNELLTSFNSKNVQLTKLEKAIVDGEEKVYAEFNFEGDIFSVFDPNKEFEGYLLTNGSFKGVLD